MRWFWVIPICGLILTGCIPVLIGAGIVTGYTLSNDSASGNVQIDYHSLWESCFEKISAMQGEILITNASKGIIKARLSDNSVTLKIDTITSDMQRLTVSARKYLMPRPQFAQKIFFQIFEEVK